MITLPPTDALLQVLRSDRPPAYLQAELRLEVALHALAEGWPLNEIIQHAALQVEGGVLKSMLALTQGNAAEAACLLKVDEATLTQKAQDAF